MPRLQRAPSWSGDESEDLAGAEDRLQRKMAGCRPVAPAIPALSGSSSSSGRNGGDEDEDGTLSSAPRARGAAAAAPSSAAAAAVGSDGPQSSNASPSAGAPQPPPPSGATACVHSSFEDALEERPDDRALLQALQATMDALRQQREGPSINHEDDDSEQVLSELDQPKQRNERQFHKADDVQPAASVPAGAAARSVPGTFSAGHQIPSNADILDASKTRGTEAKPHRPFEHPTFIEVPDPPSESQDNSCDSWSLTKEELELMDSAVAERCRHGAAPVDPSATAAHPSLQASVGDFKHAETTSSPSSESLASSDIDRQIMSIKTQQEHNQAALKQNSSSPSMRETPGDPPRALAAVGGAAVAINDQAQQKPPTPTAWLPPDHHSEATPADEASLIRGLDFSDKAMARAFGFECESDASEAREAQLLEPSGDGVLEGNQGETSPPPIEERPSEVDPCSYAPEPNVSRQGPLIHCFTERNRPVAQRQRMPVTHVFQQPVCRLWHDKFETFNHLQSEIASVLAFRYVLLAFQGAQNRKMGRSLYPMLKFRKPFLPSDDNIVVSAPTGAGKTAIFEMAMARFFTVDMQANVHQRRIGALQQISLQRKIVYVSPSKALCEERLNDWSARLLDMRLGINIALVTGDGNPSDAFRDLTSAHVILTTPEKWDSLTRRWTENFVLFASFKLLLVDEIHLLADESRGCCLESTICRMKTIHRAAANVQMDDKFIESSSYQHTSPAAINSIFRCIAVSATLPNIGEIAEFLNAGEAYVFDESYRPVPLSFHVIGQGFAGDDSKSQFRFWSGLSRNVPEIIFKYSDQRPSIVFCHSKPDAENLADLLATVSGIAIKGSGNQDIASRTRVAKLQRVLYSGIAYHHAGLEVDDRALVQKAFKDGKIRVLCATSTIAMGVNYPARLVVVKGTKAWRGGDNGYQDIDQSSLLQMIGRAGRPGFDTTGTAVIMTDNKSKIKYQNLATTGLGVAKSCFLMKKDESINTAIAQREIKSITDAINWMKQTLYYIQLLRNSSNQDAYVTHEQLLSIDNHLFHVCQETFKNLVRVGAINFDKGNLCQPSPAGLIMSQSLVEIQAMEIMRQIPHDALISDVLTAISHMPGLQRPVRRHEKKFLNEVHRLIKYRFEGPLSKVRIQEPWQKSFVLLQASIGQIPINDYSLRQEMIATVDYVSRMLGALEDISIKWSRHGRIAVHSLMLRRSLATCLWDQHDGVLSQIMNVGPKATALMKSKGISSFRDVRASTEAGIEKAARRSSPFGATLRAAVQTILQCTLKLSASIEQGNGKLSPTSLICCIEHPERSEAVELAPGSSPVSYTLMAYTDRPGGCLLCIKDLSEPKVIKVSTPPNYKRIVVILIASIVGLDQKVEIEGNVATATRLSQDDDQKRIKPCRSKKPQGWHGKVAAFETTGQSRIDETKTKLITPSPKVQILDQLETQEVNPNNSEKYPARDQTKFGRFHQAQLPPRGSYAVKRKTSDDGPSANQAKYAARASFLPEGRHNSIRDPDARLTSYRSTNTNEALDTIAPVRYHHHTPTEPIYIIPREDQGVDLDEDGTQPQSGVIHGQNVENHFRDKYKDGCPPGSAVWIRQKKEQVRSQQRAFIRKKDNPFSSYMHDPNDAESHLDQLSLQNESIIPRESRILLNRAYHSQSHDQRGMTRAWDRRGCHLNASANLSQNYSAREILVQKSYQAQSSEKRGTNQESIWNAGMHQRDLSPPYLSNYRTEHYLTSQPLMHDNHGTGGNQWHSMRLSSVDQDREPFYQEEVGDSSIWDQF